MSGVSSLYGTARILGDYSSLASSKAHTVESIVKRMESRMLGRAAGRAAGMMNMWMGMWGLVLWAQGIAFIRQLVEEGAKKDYYLGTTATYAEPWEYGHVNTWTGKQMAARPTYGPALHLYKMVQLGVATLPGLSTSTTKRMPNATTTARSGLYSSGKFQTTIQRFAKGDVGGRIATQMAGAESTRFIWGVLRNPNKNVNEIAAKTVRRIIRSYIIGQSLYDTGALFMSWETGASEKEMRYRSQLMSSKAIGEYSVHLGRDFTEEDWERKFDT